MSDKIKKYLTSLGLRLPENKEELNSFEKTSLDYNYVLKEGAIDPVKILREIKLEKAKEKTKLSKSESFFKRFVLGAKIADEYHVEITFGSVKFQKMVYLCEHASKMNFNTNYLKLAAGPFDNKFIFLAKSEFERLKWFKVEKVKQKGGYSKVIFTPLENKESYKSYYSKYFSNVHTEINYLINLFRKSRTKDVELVATIFGCWLEIFESNTFFSNEIIIQKVYDWNESKKKKFSRQDIIDKISWMQEQGIYPRR